MTTQRTQAIIEEARRQVEVHQIGDRFPRTFNAVIELVDQRDELLAALHEMVEALGAYGALASEDVESIEWDRLLDAGKVARAAVAKADGES